MNHILYVSTRNKKFKIYDYFLMDKKETYLFFLLFWSERKESLKLIFKMFLSQIFQQFIFVLKNVFYFQMILTT